MRDAVAPIPFDANGVHNEEERRSPPTTMTTSTPTNSTLEHV